MLVLNGSLAVRLFAPLRDTNLSCIATPVSQQPMNLRQLPMMSSHFATNLCFAGLIFLL